MRIAVGYVRVSDRSQEVDGDSLASQEKAIRKYAALNGYVLVEIITETFSGYYLRERKELAKIREKVREKLVDVVLVNSLDRLSRETIHQAVLLNEMNENNVSLVSVTENIDHTPMGQMMRQMLGMVAAIEREKIIERNLRGVDNKVEKGVMLGNGRPKYGYAWGDDKHTCYAIHPEQATIVRRIFEMYVHEGASIRSIAMHFIETGVPTWQGKGEWGTTTVHRILQDEFYKGVGYNRRVKWTFVDGKRKASPHPNPQKLPDGTIPRIVSDELWAAAAEKRARAKQEAARRNPEPQTALLRAGFAKCGYCNHAMVTVRHSKLKAEGNSEIFRQQYRCGTNSKAFKVCSHIPTIISSILDKAVWDFVRDALENIDAIADLLLDNTTSVATDLEAIETLIKKTQEEQERLVSDLTGLKGRVRELVVQKLNKLEDDLAKLEEEKRLTIPDSKREEQAKLEVENFLKNCQRLRGNFDSMIYAEKREALRQLGVYAKVYRKGDPDNEHYQIFIKPDIMEKLLFCVPTRSHVGTQYLVSRTPSVAWLTA